MSSANASIISHLLSNEDSYKKQRVIAYIRTSTNKQDLDNQKQILSNYAGNNDLVIDEFLEISISASKPKKQRKLNKLLNKLSAGDILLITELSRLGRSTLDIINIISELTKKQVILISLKENLHIGEDEQDICSKITVTIFSLMAELERELIRQRTKEALAVKKAKGVILGRPKGSTGKSKFDKHKQKIEKLLLEGESYTSIARRLGYKNPSAPKSLSRYVRRGR